MIQAESLAVGYDDREIVSNIKFSLAGKESLLVLGHNGAGKTTLLRTLFGLLRPLHGDLNVLDMELGELSPAALIKRGARFLGQGTRGFLNFTVADNRRLLARLYGLKPSVQGFSDNPEDKRVGDLSAGQRKLEALQLLAAGSPRLYFLDEPTAGTDAAARTRIIQWIVDARSQGASFVIAEQALEDFMSNCDYVMVVRGGRMTYFGEPIDLRSDDRLLDTYL